MPKQNLLSDLVKIAGNQRDVSPIDNILINLRVAALSKHSRSQRRKLVLLGVIVSWISALLFLPITILLSYKTLLASFAVAFIPFKVFELISSAQFLLLSAIIWPALNYKNLSRKVQHIVVDFFDFISAVVSIYGHKDYRMLGKYDHQNVEKIGSHIFFNRNQI